MILGYIIYMSKKQQNQKTNRGFTILIATIISSIVITIGVSVVGMVKQQLVLTGISEQSELAMSAADAGMECMTYWESKGYFDVGAPETSITCFEQSFSTGSNSSGVDHNLPTTAGITWTTNNSGISMCTKMFLKKVLNSNDTVTTTVIASGYNVACDKIINNPEVVERQISLTR